MIRRIFPDLPLSKETLAVPYRAYLCPTSRTLERGGVHAVLFYLSSTAL